MGRAVGVLAEGATEAATVLRRLLKSESDAVRLGAARALLQIGDALRLSRELEDRLATLERVWAKRHP
jgi:HEAT repeat protein